MGGQQEVTSSNDVDRRHGILRLPVSLATTRSPSDSDTNSGDSGRGPSCDEATDQTANNGLRVITTAATRAVDQPCTGSPASGKYTEIIGLLRSAMRLRSINVHLMRWVHVKYNYFEIILK